MTKKQLHSDATSGAVTMSKAEALVAHKELAKVQKKTSAYGKQFKALVSIEDAVNLPMQPQRLAVLKAIIIAAKTLGKDWVPAKDVIEVAMRVQNSDGSLNHGFLYMPTRFKVTEESEGTSEHRKHVTNVIRFYDSKEWHQAKDGTDIYDVR
tara:strand:+ start:195 stop:650 length:456 start_codon:yes stop_codon:yes gene_type:complete